MQQRRAQRLGIQAHTRADTCHVHGVHDEILAGLTPLGGVVLAGEHKCVAHAVAVDLDRRVLGVLGDDREQVAEQPPLEIVQIQTLGAWPSSTLQRGGARVKLSDGWSL